MTKKKFAELELSLLHLQQNVEIPETHLVIHPVIQRAVEQVHHPYVSLSIGIDVNRHEHPARVQISRISHQNNLTIAPF